MRAAYAINARTLRRGFHAAVSDNPVVSTRIDGLFAAFGAYTHRDHAWGGITMKSILAAFVLAMCAYVTGALYQTAPDSVQHDGTRGSLKIARLH